MNKKIVSSVLFIFIFLILLNVIVIRNNPYLTWKKKYWDQMAGVNIHQPKYVFLGDSHAAAIKQEFLPDNSFNLSSDGDSAKEMYAKVQYLIEHDKALKGIFLSADYHLFSKHKELNNNQDVFSDRCPLVDPNAYVFFRQKIEGKIKSIFLKEKQNWAQRSSSKRQQIAEGRAKEQLSHPLSEEMIKAYQSIVDLCREHNVKVVALRYPLSVEYRAALKNYDLSAVETIYRSILFSQFLDYENSFDDVKYFSDQDHLNAEGAAVFLKRLYKDIDIDF